MMDRLKKENMILWVVIAFAATVLLGIMGQGCATPGNICMSIPEGQTSVICALADKTGIPPESMSMILQVANASALEGSVYTAQEAKKFIDTIMADLTAIKTARGKITYIEAINYINKKFDLLPAKAQAAFLIIDPAGLAMQEITMPLSDYDIGLIIRHLQKQAVIVRIYL